MSESKSFDDDQSQTNITIKEVEEDLQRQPQLLLQLAENTLTIADSLRDNYFKNTARFVAHLRQAMVRPEPILRATNVSDISWSDLQNEVVTFIDGGVGQVQIASQVPLLLRVGSYCVHTVFILENAI